MATPNEQSPDIMKRRAINSSGHLASLYDGCRDHVIEKSIKHFPEKHFRLFERPHCEVINGNTKESDNLLQYIGVEDELRLSLLLNLTKRDGIGAVLDYPDCVDEHTRFLYYSWRAYQHQLLEYPEGNEIIGKWHPCVSATHIITSIDFGMDVIVVLQLPSESNHANKIDYLLNKVCEVFSKDELNNFKLSTAQRELLRHIIKTTVYSNLPNLINYGEFSRILEQIVAAKKHASCRPLSYTLQTITSLYPAQMLRAVVFKPLPVDLEKDVEHHIIQFRNMAKRMEPFCEPNVSKISSGRLQCIFKEFCIQPLHVRKECTEEIRRFLRLVVDSRSGQISISEISEALRDNKQISMKKNIDGLVQTLEKCHIKDPSITNVRQKVSRYWNITQRYFDQSEDTSINERRFTNDVPQNRNLNPTKPSNENNQSKPIDQHPNSVQKPPKNYIIPPTYVDSHDSPFQVGNNVIPASDEIKHSGKYSQQQALPKPVSPIPEDVPSFPPETDNTINILLLGETGVGKSIFINAFANYLVFKSLDQAQVNEPIVIIPVSFIMTVGDSFEERTIKFGEIDSSNNENFNKVGQSVTQHCKSYLFDPHHFDGKKLRIIDTPGFGDTRGLDQDDRNMEHILQYINNLSHLNAICLLLKPNSSRLNIFFRTCLTQLFSFLAPTVRKNIIFCFTNARSTFYTPGDTALLLRTMLASSSMTDIPFGKENTFCFDSESFRYLVALRHRIPFTQEAKREYGMSWSTSAKESNRLINYIDTTLILYHMDDGYQSIKHAQFEISHMIRPMLEAMRNFLRSLILYEKKLSNQLIELQPKALHRIAIRCHSCKLDPHVVGKFWIIPDLPNAIQTDFPTCSCTPDRHVPIDYTLEFELSNNASEYNSEQMTVMLDKLRQACAKFAHFLMHVACSTKNDPFLIGLSEMIEEEYDICRSQTQIVFNQQLVEELKKCKKIYEQLRNQMKPDQVYVELTVIYQSIKTVRKYPYMREQMTAAKETQQNMMAEYEYEPQRI